MTKRDLPRPTDAELEILRVLWRRGPSTVREVHEELRRKPATRYTTALKLMQIMTEKGLVRRDESQRAHIYRPRLPREQTLRQLARDLLERAFGGSAALMVASLLDSRAVRKKDIGEIKKLIAEREGKGRK